MLIKCYPISAKCISISFYFDSRYSLKWFSYIPRGSFKVLYLPIPQKRFSRLTFCISCHPWGGFLIYLRPWGRMMMLIFCGESHSHCSMWRACYVVMRGWSLSHVPEVDVGTTLASCILLLLRCCSSRCVTFLTKHVSFLAKSVSFILKCIALLNFSLYSCTLLLDRESQSRCLMLVYYLHITPLSQYMEIIRRGCDILDRVQEVCHTCCQAAWVCEGYHRDSK